MPFKQLQFNLNSKIRMFFALIANQLCKLTVFVCSTIDFVFVYSHNYILNLAVVGRKGKQVILEEHDFQYKTDHLAFVIWVVSFEFVFVVERISK